MAQLGTGRRGLMALASILALLAGALACVRSAEQPRAASEPARVALPPPAEPPPESQPPPSLRPGRIAESPGPVSIDLSPCASARCELTFTFSMPMAGAESPVEARLPKVEFEPPQDGALAWRSPTELVFTPADGALGWGHRVVVTIPAATPVAGERHALRRPWRSEIQVPHLQVAGKVASWPIVVGRPRLVGILDGHTGMIGAGPVLVLYDQPVIPEVIEKYLEVIDADGTPLGTYVDTPGSIRRVADAEIDTRMVAAVQIDGLPEAGTEVSLLLPQWRGKGRRPDLIRKSLTVSTPLVVESIVLEGRRRDERVPLKAVWRVRFSRQVELEHLRGALVISPEPVSLEVTRTWRGAVTVTAELSPGGQYWMTTANGLTDVLGNPLAEPLDLSFQAQDLAPFLSAPSMPMLLEKGRPLLPVRARNVGDLRVRSWRFTGPEAFAQALANPRRTSCDVYSVDGPIHEAEPAVTGAEPNVISSLDLPVDNGGGLLCVEVRGNGRGSEAAGGVLDAVLVQSSDLGVTAKVFPGTVFAWVTRLGDASPVARAAVRLLDERGAPLDEGFTDALGTVELAAGKVAGRAGLDRPVHLVAALDGDVVVARLVDEHLSHAWQFGLASEVRDAGRLDAVVFTERGVYRPGETVHTKVMLGSSGGDPPTLQVSDPRGKQVLSRELELDRFGTAAADLELAEQAPVGEYVIRLSRGRAVAVRTFRVEEYRVPTFRVTVEADPLWKRGDEVRATIAARYLHGGRLDGREVRWRVWRSPEPFAPKAFPGFVFGLGEGNPFEGAVTSGTGRLNGDGEQLVAFRAEHPSSAGAMRYLLEASVTDVDRQTYAARLARVVHPAAFSVGLRPPPRAVLAEGETLEVPVVAVTPDGAPLAGVPVRARLERIDHHTTARLSSGSTVQLLNRPVPVEQQECEVVTAEHAVSCRFSLAEAGQYRVRVWALDAEHREVQAGFPLAASGDSPAAWPRFDQDRVEVMADRARYRAGDIARLVVESPFEHATGLLTVERDRVLEHRLFTIDGDTPALEVLITADHAPNVYVSVVLIRGRTHELRDASGYETGAPGFRMGYARLPVEPGEQRLAVRVVPSADTATPGQVVHVGLEVRDSTGAPAPGVATVFAVDEAVLSLTGYRTPDPVAQLHAERPLSVRTGETRHDLLHSRRSRSERVFAPSGDGGAFDLSSLPDEMRKLFKSTAYWNPNVAVDLDGSAALDIELPDNTTTYRIMAVVAGSPGRVGADDDRIVVRKPLMVQPVLPRFVYPGDELQVEALVFNGTDAAGEVALTGEMSGFEPRGGAVAGSALVSPGAQGSFVSEVTVSGRDEARVRYAARLGEHADAVEVTVPIHDPGTRRTLVEGRPVTGSGAVTIGLPAERIPGTTRVEVVMSTTVLSELKDAVQYLMRYPNGCIEQTTSTAYPLVVLRDLLPEIGVEVDMADLKEFAAAGIRRILSFQTPSGGLSYWPGGSQPHAFATAFGLTALIEGKRRGYDVPDSALEGMADYLEASLREGAIRGEMPHGGMADADTRALFVMTLGRLGRPQPAYISTLWRSRDKLTPFGLSFLALAVQELPGDRSLHEPILAEIRGAAREEEGEAWFEGRPRGGWSFDSPLRTHAGALLACASGGSGEMSGKLLAGLLERRRGGLWGNTQENVFGIMGAHAAASRASAPSGERPRLELRCNGRLVADEEIEKVSSRVRRLTLLEGDLGLQEGEARVFEAHLTNRGSVPVHLSVRAELEVPLTEETRRPTAHGFSVSRRYETMGGDDLEGAPIPLGSLVRVRLVVHADSHQNYVAIDDRLPAGLEPLNASLETTERVARGAFSAAVQRGLSVLSYSEIRDHRVAFFADDMLPGDYELTYVARATTPGTFLRPAGRVEAMYQPSICATTAVDTVRVR